MITVPNNVFIAPTNMNFKNVLSKNLLNIFHSLIPLKRFIICLTSYTFSEYFYIKHKFHSQSYLQ